MLAPVHENLAVAVDVPLEQEIDVGRRFDDLPGIGSVAWNARGQAIRFRVFPREVLLHDHFGLWLQRDFLAFLETQGNVFNQENISGAPQSGEVDSSAGQMGRRADRRGSSLTLGLHVYDE